MAIQSYVSFDFTVSPRIIWIDTSVSTSISVQDLIDTCMYTSAQAANIDDAILLISSGKEYLTADGSVKVGLTVTLNNAKIGFVSQGAPSWILCSIEGGNVVAVEDVYTTPRVYIDVIHPTAYISIERVSSSSATLSELSAIQYASFGGGVTIDVINGTAGTDFPIGTIETPSSNIVDGTTIADGKGFNTFFINSNITLSNTVNLENYTIKGESIIKSKIIIEPDALVFGTEFVDATISGTLDGDNTLHHCAVQTLNYVNGHVHNCLLESGVITLGGNKEAHFLDCWSGVVGTDTPTIDMGGSGQGLGLRNYNGGIKLINKAGSEKISIDLNSGHVILDSTVSGTGEIVIRGIGKVTDNSIGGNVNSDYLVGNVAEDVWTENISTYTTGVGRVQQLQVFAGKVVIDVDNGFAGTEFPTGTNKKPSNNLTDTLTIASGSGLSIISCHSNVTIGSSHDVSGMVVESQGIMGTDVVLEAGCLATNTSFKYLNLSGIVTNGDTLLIESCSIGNLANFTGIMNVATFAQGSEITIGYWANFISCHAGGDPGNEPELNIGTAEVNINKYTGNLKLIGKTGTNRTVASFQTGNVIVDSTCVSGTIQILGIGDVEADNSGPNCTVDVDAAITNDFIAEHVWVATGRELSTPNNYKADVANLDVAVSTRGQTGEYTTTLSNIKTETDKIPAMIIDLTFIKDVEGGKWIIDETTNQMIFYESDNVTEIARFNLYDVDDVAASEDVYRRDRV